MSVIFRIDRSGRKALSKPNEDIDDGIYLPGTNGKAVILIHGMTGTPNEMRYLATYFHKENYTVACPRLANHGKPLAVLKRTKWQDFYASCREAYDKVRKDNDIVFTSGLSMGALLALALADEYRYNVRGISCLSPTLFYDGWNMPWSRHLIPLCYHTPLKYFFFFKEDPPYGIKNERLREIIHRYYNKARFEDMEGVAEYGYPYFPGMLICQLHLLVKHLEKRLPYIETPVQMIQAQEDDITSVKNSLFIRDHIGSAKKELVLLYNSYHVITADQERDVVAEKMSGFFREIINAERG